MVDFSAAARRRLGNFKVNKGTPVAPGDPALRKSSGGDNGVDGVEAGIPETSDTPLAQAIRNKNVKKA